MNHFGISMGKLKGMTNKVFGAMHGTSMPNTLKYVSNTLSNVRKAYNDAYAKSQQRPGAVKARENARKYGIGFLN